MKFPPSLLDEIRSRLPVSAVVGRKVRLIKAGRDVTWRLTDPLPLLTMPWMARRIISAARRDGVPFGIAATRDLSPG
jgi:hypothetical protein